MNGEPSVTVPAVPPKTAASRLALFQAEIVPAPPVLLVFQKLLAAAQVLAPPRPAVAPLGSQ